MCDKVAEKAAQLDENSPVTTICPDVTSVSDDSIAGYADTIIAICSNASDTRVNSQNKNIVARTIIPIVTGLTAGGLGAGITASVIEAKKEDIKNKAVAEWMEDIGEHIQCFVGTDELGSYGDTIAIEID